MKAKPASSFRSALGRVRGLGSARNGTAHWWAQRLSAIVLIPLSLYVFITFLGYVVFGGYEGAIYWMRGLPFMGVAVILFLIVGFHHAANGLQEVIEDYVHGEYAKLASLLVVRFLAAAFAVFGVFAVLSIQFQGLMTHAKGL